MLLVALLLLFRQSQLSWKHYLEALFHGKSEGDIKNVT